MYIIKIKVPKHHGKKTYREVTVKFNALLISALDEEEEEQLALCSGCFIPGE
jgi:hypothetical protein